MRKNQVMGLAVALVIAVAWPALALTAGRTERVSLTSQGGEGSSASQLNAISGDGRYVAFDSWANNLVPGDTNNWADIFVRDTQTGETTRVNVSSSGEEANHNTVDPDISDDGRYVTFGSQADNLAPGDTNGTYTDIYVHDRATGQTYLVSQSTSGVVGNSHSNLGRISGNGRFVTFRSLASNLVSDDTNGLMDIFVHDLQTRETTRVSVTNTGAQANGTSANPEISADGRHVAFISYANNLVPDDTNGIQDIFVHDRQTAQNTLVSVSSSGEQANAFSENAALSGDGRYVAYASEATNLVPGDTNGVRDIFVHDLLTGQTVLASVSSTGEQGNGMSVLPALSSDGRYITFVSNASNLVPDDTNGAADIFLRDLQAGTTIRVSVQKTNNKEANAGSTNPDISADGLTVSFFSNATNLVPNDDNRSNDVFTHSL